jgi:hypothetical protein
MDLEPVKKYSSPNYPDKQTIIKNPKLLKTMPERWKGNMYVCTALSSLIMFMFSGCVQKGVSGAEPANGKLEAVPIFEHGTGRGSFGCSSVAPPAFISEEEAFQVIQEEGKKYGLVFDKKDLKLENVKIPETKYMLSTVNGKSAAIDSTRKGNLVLDGYDEAKKVGFEFISTDDYEEWQIKSNTRSTVDEFDFLSTAKLLQSGINESKSESSVGIFYNPMMSLKASEKLDIDALQNYTTDSAKEDLRKQVKDFLQWLKAQGII